MTPILERDLKRSTTQPGVYVARFEDDRRLFIVKVEQQANKFTSRKTHLEVRAVIVTQWFWEIKDPNTGDPETIRSYTSPPHGTRRDALAAANAFASKYASGEDVPEAVCEDQS